MLKEIGLLGDGFVFRVALETSPLIDPIHQLDLYIWENDVKILRKYDYNLSKACFAIADLDEGKWLKHQIAPPGSLMGCGVDYPFKKQKLRTLREVEDILHSLSHSIFL